MVPKDRRQIPMDRARRNENPYEPTSFSVNERGILFANSYCVAIIAFPVGAIISAAEEAGIIGAGVGAGGVALCGVTFVGGVGVGYCIGYYPAQWKCERECKVHLQKINIKKGKWRCTAKARNWNKGTPCYDQIYDGEGKSESDAYDAAWQACVDAGCHQPGRGGDCGHVTCFQKP